jgi:glycosyltransferase involved in cell wall biosynthesis
VRVVHLAVGSIYGGVETFLVTLARHREAAVQLEQEFAVCFPGRFRDELTECGAPVHDLGAVQLRYPWSVFRARHRLAKLLRERQFDAVVCHMPWSAAVFGRVALRAGQKLIFWVHASMDGKDWIERWARLNRPDLAICNSRFTAPDLGNIYPGVRSRLIYYPVEMTASATDFAERSRIRAQFEVSTTDVLIIQVSRMEPWKGHSLHLDALARLKDVPNWKCWMVGGSQRHSEALYVDGLKSKAKELGIDDRIHFLGQRSDVKELLAAADIFCQPNIVGEPFGIVFIEALAAGLPVVATDMGGPKEILDKSCGILVPENDPGKLANILGQLIVDTSSRKRLGSAGIARAKMLCAPSDRILEFEEAVRSVLTGRIDEGSDVLPVGAEGSAEQHL